jgi:hypothetical protein
MNTIGNIGNINPRDYKSVNDKLTNNEGTLKDLVKNSNDTVSVDVKEKMDNKVGTENEENSESEDLCIGGWRGGLFRIAELANNIAPFTVKFAGVISFLAGLGALFNLADGMIDLSSKNVYNKIDGIIDLASVGAWGAGVLGSISAPVSLAIVAGLYGAKIINYAIAKHNENKQR